MPLLILRGALSWLLLIAVAPIAAPVILTLFLTQSLVLRLSKSSNGKKLGIENQIASLDHLFAVDNFYTKPRGANLLVYILEGPINPMNLKLKVSQILSGNKGYDRLTSLRPTKFHGFPFWTTTGSKGTIQSQFRVENHFIEDTVKICGSEELDSYIVQHLQRPFHKDRPLWDLLYLNNFFLDNKKGEPIEQRSVYVFRNHHVIGDGQSMLNFFKAITDNSDSHLISNNSSNANIHSKKRKTKINWALENCQELFWAPLMTINHVHDFCFHKNFITNPKKANTEMQIVRTEIPISKFAAIRKQLFKNEPLGSLAVQNLIAAGALRQHYKREFGVDDNQLGSARAFASLPWNKTTAPENIRQFKNQFTVGIFKMPVNEPLRKIRTDKILKGVRIASRCRFLSAYVTTLPLYRIFPFAFLQAMAAYNMGCPALLSNVPGPKHPVHVDGKRVLSMFGIAGLSRQHGGMTNTLLSYDKTLSATFLFNKELIPSSDASFLAKDYKAEVDLILADKE